MRRIVLVVCVLMLAGNVLADDLCEFKGIPFGTDKAEVLSRLGYTDDHKDKNRFYVFKYNVSDRPTSLTLNFDNSGSFFGFTIRFEKYTANKIEYDVNQDVAFISAAFKNKYGAPTKSLDFKMSDIIFKEGNQIRDEWDNNVCVARTSIGHYNSEFFAQADVLESKLFRDFMADRRAKKATSAKKAAKDF